MSRHRNSASSTLYIRNISDRVRYDDIRRLFQKYGRLVDVTIPLDYYTGHPKGYCFIEFEDIRDAEKAQYQMDRQRLFGREIEVEFARGDRKTPGEMRTRDRDFSRNQRRDDRRGEFMHESNRRSRSRSRDRRNGRGFVEREYRGGEREYRGERDYRGGERDYRAEREYRSDRMERSDRSSDYKRRGGGVDMPPNEYDDHVGRGTLMRNGSGSGSGSNGDGDAVMERRGGHRASYSRSKSRSYSKPTSPHTKSMSRSRSRSGSRSHSRTRSRTRSRSRSQLRRSDDEADNDDDMDDMDDKQRRRRRQRRQSSLSRDGEEVSVSVGDEDSRAAHRSQRRTPSNERRRRSSSSPSLDNKMAPEVEINANMSPKAMNISMQSPGAP